MTREIDTIGLYEKLKDEEYKINIFRRMITIKNSNKGKNVSITRHYIKPEHIAIYPDCYITARKGNVEIIATNQNFGAIWEEDIHVKPKAILRKITTIPISTLDDLKRIYHQGDIINDIYHNIGNMMYPDYEESGKEEWLQLPDTENDIYEIPQLAEVPKSSLEAALKLIELGQPVSQFYGELIEEFANIKHPRL